MKKVAVLGLASLFLLTGCGSNKVTCKSDEGKVTATIKNDKVTNISMEMTASSKEEAQMVCALYKEAKCSGKTVKISDAASLMGYSKSDLSKLSKDDFKKAMEASDFKC
ncbi:MAG: hypothetical protein J5634_00655 [Bacilli bacterium]|nr:hypothetical protein [Bacilli bacterium]